MKTVDTKYGELPVTSQVEYFADGNVASAVMNKVVTLESPVGLLTPQYTADDLRRREVAGVAFHASGALKSVPLEQSTMVPTPAGMLPAELVTFHENGAVNRVFPLNGKLSGYWTQGDEAALAKQLVFQTARGVIRTRIISVCFTDSGMLRSLTLWPGEEVELDTPAGRMAVRVGVSFHPDGSIRSVEPAEPTAVITSAGEVMAIDPDAVGINGDSNSLVFSESGEIERVTTTLTSLVNRDDHGRITKYEPLERESLCGDTDAETVPMILELQEKSITIRQGPETLPVILDAGTNTFSTSPYLTVFKSPLEMIPCSV